MMGQVDFEAVVELALQLTPQEQAQLMERLAGVVSKVLSDSSARQFDAEDFSTDTPRTPEDIAGLMMVEPMTGAEIVAAGLLGGWADEDINDGAEWVNEQKRRRKEGRRW